MQDIVKQIIQIDSIAYTTKQNNEEMLKEKRQQYEEQMRVYREETIEKAQQRADELYNQIVEAGMHQYQMEEEKSKQVALLIENRYLQIEKSLLDRIFNELFNVEE